MKDFLRSLAKPLVLVLGASLLPGCGGDSGAPTSVEAKPEEQGKAGDSGDIKSRTGKKRLNAQEEAREKASMKMVD